MERQDMRKNIEMLGLVVLLASVGCDDPAEDVAAATVNEQTAETPEEAAGEETAAADESEANVAYETLTIDSENSTIAFVGSKVTRSHEGGFREFSGTLEYNPEAGTVRNINVTIQTASLFADEERLTEHLKSGDFFNVAEIPTATFRSTNVTAGEGDAPLTITGDLTLHGQTQSISFPATVSVTDGEARATSEFSINRHDFGLTYPGMPDDLIRDLVVIRLNLRAPRS